MEIYSKFMALWMIFLLFFIDTVSALECYVCENQDSNKDKCVKTSVQCEEHQDMCETQISWGLPPYWIPYGDRVHYVWKSCNTRTNCEAERAAMMPHCKRDWYDDWTCIECCAGDLCNYYVTLGADSVQANTILLSFASLCGLLLRWLT